MVKTYRLIYEDPEAELRAHKIFTKALDEAYDKCHAICSPAERERELAISKARKIYIKNAGPFHTEPISPRSIYR